VGMETITLIGIKLNQFDDYQNCSWVKGLISLSSDFFNTKKVLNGTLFLESTPSMFNESLELLSEASSMDFSYIRYKAGNIAYVEKLLKGA
jgi:hypothetical protein